MDQVLGASVASRSLIEHVDFLEVRRDDDVSIEFLARACAAVTPSFHPARMMEAVREEPASRRVAWVARSRLIVPTASRSVLREIGNTDNYYLPAWVLAELLHQEDTEGRVLIGPGSHVFPHLLLFYSLSKQEGELRAEAMGIQKGFARTWEPGTLFFTLHAYAAN